MSRQGLMPAKVLSSCMVKDRFRLGKLFNGGHLRSEIKVQVARSMAEAASRASRLPQPHYPEVLPVSQKVTEIQQAIQGNQVVIVAGETGSGKTTQLPKICLDLKHGVYGMIGHTQPRRIAARTVAHRIAAELDVTLGEEIGYQVRFTDQTSAYTLVKVMTDGILLAETQQDRFLEQYDTLIIDEAHERSLNIDFLLGYIKRILAKRSDLSVIITSATIDVKRFSKHFSNAPIVEVSGRTYPVEVIYRAPESSSKIKDSDQQMYAAILATLQEIVNQTRKRPIKGDVLVFLSGEREIRDLARLIRKADLKGFEVLPLYSRLNVREQNRVFQAHQNCRIVLTTNVAETSLTVPGIRYVIDPGFARVSRYSVRSKVQQLPIEPISKASAEQRKGRCGRVSAGVCYRLYSEADYLARPDFTTPEILRTNLASVILQMLNLRLGSIAKFPFIEPPQQRQINDGYHLLRELLAVDDQRKITREGRQMAHLPVDLRLARMLLEASKRGCLTEMLTIVSALAIQDPLERPHEQQQAATEKHRQFWDERSDFVAYLKLWEHLETQRQLLTNNQFRNYCREHFISYMRYVEWRGTHRQLRLMCNSMALVCNHHSADYESIHISLLSGLLGNIGEKHDGNAYLGVRHRHHYIFPSSSQFKRQPKWIVSAELVETSKLFARLVAQIDYRWIEPLAAHLVKRTYYEPYFAAKPSQVLAYEDVILYGLSIIKRRKVDFSTIDPVTARHIFIQAGLVERALDSKAAFYRHNGELIADIERWEAKFRKCDLLVDSHTVYRFYAEKLPAEVCNHFQLNVWRKAVESQQPKLLYMSKQDLLREVIESPENLYPNQLAVAATRLDLAYHFDPQHEDDGVSIKIPLAMIRQVQAKQLDWMIPGLLQEKCLALLKTLPKSLRKHFIPVANYAEKVAAVLEYAGKSLPETLAEKLFRWSGVKVKAADFTPEAIAKHLKMNIKIVDDQGQVLATSRDLAGLVSRFVGHIEQALAKPNGHAIEQTGLTDWCFGSLPAEISFSQAGLQIKGYPALVDKMDSVSIEVKDNRELAAMLTRQGLLRLIMLQLRDQKKYITQNIPGFDQCSLYYATCGPKQALREDLVMAIFRYTFIENKPAVTTEQQFRERLQARQELMAMTHQVAMLTAEILKHLVNIEEVLQTKIKHQHPVVYEDIKRQLAGLTGQHFLVVASLEWLKQYPRYLKAIGYRLERLRGNITRDADAISVVNTYWQRLGDGAFDPKLQHYRWMLEEFRVSLFAQSLGTRIPISTKRLDKEWRKANP